MTTTSFNQALASNYTQSETFASPFAKFMAWCNGQQYNRLLWLGVILAVHGCILTPLTVMTVLSTGNHFVLFMTAMVAMTAPLVTNLAAMPTKVTIPVFFLSVFVDIVILISTITYGFDMAGVGM